jgi:hypothetical protein
LKSAAAGYLEILPRHGQRLFRRLRLGLVEFGRLAFVERNPVPRDIHEEIAAMREAIVHFAQRVDDEVDRRAQRLRDRKFAVEPVLGGRPEFDAIGQLVVVDDDEQIEVGLIALGGVRFIDPAAARIAAVEDDLENARVLLPVGRRDRGCVAEFLEQNLDDALQLALLGRWKMVETGLHRSSSYRHEDGSDSLAGQAGEAASIIAASH